MHKSLGNPSSLPPLLFLSLFLLILYRRQPHLLFLSLPFSFFTRHNQAAPGASDASCSRPRSAGARGWAGPRRGAQLRLRAGGRAGGAAPRHALVRAGGVWGAGRLRPRELAGPGGRARQAEAESAERRGAVQAGPARAGTRSRRVGDGSSGALTRRSR
jgi:hypothetical protein